MATDKIHDTVLDAGSLRFRIARLYAEALLSAASRQNDPKVVTDLGEELNAFVRDVLSANPAAAAFLGSAAIGKKAKAAVLDAALPGRTSGLFRGLVAVLTRNGRLDLLRGVAAAYHRLLDDRAGRVQVKVTSAVELSEPQRAALTGTLSGILKQQPVLDVRVDPNLLGGLIVQVGDRVIDTSIRTRLQTLRTLLLDKGNSYVVQN